MCYFCNKQGYIAKVYKSRMAQSTVSKPPVAMDSSKPTHQVTWVSSDTVSSEYTLFTLPSQQSTSLQANIEVEGYHLKMEINKGAAVYIIHDTTCTELSHLLKLLHQPTEVITITRHGLYCYTCLPFGVALMPGIFLSTMKTMFRGLLLCILMTF